MEDTREIINSLEKIDREVDELKGVVFELRQENDIVKFKKNIKKELEKTRAVNGELKRVAQSRGQVKRQQHNTVVMMEQHTRRNIRI